MRKSLRLALTRPTSLYKGGCFPQKDGRRVRVSLPFLQYTEKRYRGKSRYLSWRRRRDSTGFHPSCSLCEQFILCPFLLRKKMDEEFESLCPFCNIQKKGTGENPDTFSGAEGETRRVFNPSCSLCEQFILCPFLLRKKMDEEFESLQTNSYIQKEKAQRKNPCAFSGAEGETRTLAPVTRPTPLAGAPRHQLEYFCIGSVYDTIQLLKERAENPLPLLSGGESGIRTHGTLPYDGFQDRSVITTSVSLRIRRKL